MLFGVALALSGNAGRPVQNFLESLTVPVFKVVHIVMKFAPLGAFGAMAFTIGKFGVGSLINLAELVATFYITSLLFVLVILGAVARACGFSVLKLIKYLKPSCCSCWVPPIRIGPAVAHGEDGARRLPQVRGRPWSCPPATRSTWTAPTST